MADYPRHVHRRGGIYRVIEDDAALAAARQEGWESQPLTDWPVPEVYREWVPDLTPAEAPKQPRGRPRQTPKASEG